VAWLDAHDVHLVSPVKVELIAGGRSNLTYALTDGAGRKVVLRRPPADGVLPTAHDMRREWSFLSALADSVVPVAQPLAFAQAGEVFEVPCYAMSYVEGLVLHNAADAEVLSEDARHGAASSLIDTMAALHSVDIDAVGLGDIAKRGDYIGRQLRRWYRQWERSCCTDLAVVREAHDRLERLVPPQARTTIVHGDFRLGNMICGRTGTMRAVLDWELATLGDPLADLGWLLSSWLQPEEASAMPAAEAPPSALPGFPTRDSMVRRYAERSGADVSSCNFYTAFAHWRGACISSGVLTRYEAGVMGDDGFDTSSLRAVIASRAEAALLLLDAL
jgi:aminoglycoside phosphotransferase (APT) family kinase protein